MAKFKRISTTSERLKKALELSGMKQADLVRKTGIDRGTISNYVHGKYEPKSEAINKLAVALNVSEAWLCGYDVSPARQDWEADVDIINNAVIRMRSDNDFMSVVEALLALDSEKFSVAKTVITALKK